MASVSNWLTVIHLYWLVLAILDISISVEIFDWRESKIPEMVLQPEKKVCMFSTVKGTFLSLILFR